MNTFKVYILHSLILSAFILSIALLGCEGSLLDNLGKDNDFRCHTGGKNCRVHYDRYNCFSTFETCKIFGGCGSVKFTAEPTKSCPEGNECKWKCCPLCSSSSAILFNQIITEEETSLTILNIEQTCDVITKGKFSPISDEDCEDLASYRVCKSFDFMPSEKDNLVSQCLLYECEDCLLDVSDFDEDFVE